MILAPKNGPQAMVYNGADHQACGGVLRWSKNEGLPHCDLRLPHHETRETIGLNATRLYTRANSSPPNTPLDSPHRPYNSPYPG